MKSKDNSLNNVFSILYIFCFVFFGFTKAVQAQNPLDFPALQVEGLSSYTGRHMSVAYVVATTPGMALKAEDLTVKTIYRLTSSLLITENSINFALQSIRWTGAAKPNFILLIIHSKPVFNWATDKNSAIAIRAFSAEYAFQLRGSTADGVIKLVF